ncbi:Likely ferric reductase, partial [Candida maltosa Xu316]
MLAIRSIIFLVACLFASSQAGNTLHIYHNDEFSVQACTGYIPKVATLFNATTDKVGFCNVKNQQALGTMAQCIEMMPHKNARKEFLASCKKYNLTESLYLAALENATEFGFYNISANPDFKKAKLFYEPVLLKKKNVHAAYDAVATRWYNYNYAQWFGIAAFSYWFLVVLIAGVCNLTYFLFPSFIKSLKGGVVNAYRKYITLPALFKKTHAHHRTIFGYFAFVFPTRLETILVTGWFIMVLIMNLTNYVHVKPNYIWPQRANEFGRKIADRTGQMSLWIIPPMVMFAGRNNFLQWISGWSHARFIYFHKWMSRVVFMLSIAHGVGMTYNGKNLGKYYTRNAQPYVRWGYVALVAMAVMCFQAMMVFRRKNYELFLAIHIILAVFAIAGTWIHTTEQEYQMWMYGAVAVWGFDRAVRLARLAFFGLKTAKVQLIANETLKVTVARPSWWKPFPGCHAFIHFMRPTCFWQSHPFTIVDSVLEANTITFYIKVKGGMTHGLYQYLSQQPGQTAQIKVSIEGPYGNRLPIDRFENELFIAGGNGIPGIYYEAIDVARRLGEKRNVK